RRLFVHVDAKLVTDSPRHIANLWHLNSGGIRRMKPRGDLIKTAFAVLAATLLLLTFALPSLAGALPEPVARAGRGLLQCYAPDAQRKRCAALAAFKTEADGRMTTTATILVSPNPRIFMTGKALVFVRSGELCGT